MCGTGRNVMRHALSAIASPVMLAMTVALSGCQLAAAPVAGVMTLANAADQRSQNRHAKQLWDDERARVKALQASGDPMGDYLYAIGNAQGWIQDTNDPVKIVELLRKAADKGSSDAMIMLGFYYFDDTIPLDVGVARLPGSMVDRALGESLIRAGIKVRCTYARPVARRDGVYLKYASAAAIMKYAYRDGVYKTDASSRTSVVLVPRNPHLERVWSELDDQCRATAFIG